MTPDKKKLQAKPVQVNMPPQQIVEKSMTPSLDGTFI
jgi:hypothetical protein